MDFRTTQAAHIKLRAQALVFEILAPILPAVGVFAVEQCGKRMEEFVVALLEYVDTAALDATEVRF